MEVSIAAEIEVLSKLVKKFDLTDIAPLKTNVKLKRDMNELVRFNISGRGS